MDQLTFWSGERPASPSVSQDSGQDSTTQEETLPLFSSDLLRSLGLGGLSGKTSPVSCHPTEDGILVPSSGRWLSSGMGSPTEYWTLNTSEFPNDAVGSMLSDILETGDVPQAFYLSAKACRGILRRAQAKNISLPERLRQILLADNGGMEDR